MHRCFAIALLLVCAVAACERGPSPPSADTAPGALAGSGWAEFVDAHIERFLEAHPAFAVVQGRHEYDGRLPDWSRAGIEGEIARLKQARADALAFDDGALNGRERYQRDYLVARLDHDLFWLEEAQWPFRNPGFYIGWLSDSLDPSPYITLNYAPAAERLAAFTRYLDAIPQAAAQIRENLRMPMPQTWLQFGIDAFGGYADYFADEAPQVWTDVEDAELQAAYRQANALAIGAMRSLAAWLESQREHATDDYALGPDLFRQMLWDTERVDVSLDELEAIGRADLVRNQRALRIACEYFAAGQSMQQCFARMADRKPEGGAVEAARRQLGELHAFVVEQELVSIPGDEEARVEEAPPYARSNFAYINIPGPYAKNQPSTYYIAPPNPQWSEEVQRAYVPGEADLLFTSVHEVWPGHFLNFLHANRSDWIFGRLFVGYAFAEGWAHYSEEMMFDAGLRDQSAETRIGQVSNALLRNARLLSALGLHTRDWSVDESRRFFIEEAFQDEGTAIQQAARGTYDPAYLNYNMGKLLIMKLREDWSAERGGRTAWREFHDAFLSYGGPPIPLVRRQMMNEPAPRTAFPDFVTPH